MEDIVENVWSILLDLGQRLKNKTILLRMIRINGLEVNEREHSFDSVNDCFLLACYAGGKTPVAHSKAPTKGEGDELRKAAVEIKKHARKQFS